MQIRYGRADLRGELMDRLNTSLPAVAAPMFLVSGPALVAATCTSGMVAAFPSLNARTTEDFRDWMRQLQDQHTPQSAAFAVNLVTHRSNPRFAADLQACVEARVPLIITALGSPTPAIEAVNAYGGLVFADVNTPALARKAAAAGADGLILVCCGAGGHTGTLSPFAFVDEVRQFFDGPVVVAGGISTGGAIRAVRAMGADLAYLGTRFLAARESLAVEDFKAMVINSDFGDIMATDAITGALANKLRPSLVRAGVDPESLVSGRPFDLTKLDENTRKWRDLWSAGHGVGQVKTSESAEDIVASLMQGYLGAAA
ncbi:nitronate monooxygenase [Pararhodobacter sp.]|uniref:NAD(P)H-dependent flavin oxidoreductase n=1 Tax=Pararhodobacter sp. TaxID=2127056 RepID=UPI002AFE3365|nr:nitronate monooxygenase [Pararhodobacter sp.]